MDQNKWIQLAQISTGKLKSDHLLAAYSRIVEASDRGNLLVPLTASNILETLKRNDFSSREVLAKLQARLSQGFVFRSRKTRLLAEIENALRIAIGQKKITKPWGWAIAPNFIRAFEEEDFSAVSIAELTDEFLDPRDFYLNFVLQIDESNRRQGNALLSTGGESLLSRIDARRNLISGVPKGLRWRAYAVRILYENQVIINPVLASYGYTLEMLAHLGQEVLVKFVCDIPTFKIEIELAVLLEGQMAKLKINDIGDMENFCTCMPYVNFMVTEKHFASLANQLRLGSEYGVGLYTKIEDLIL